MKPKETSDPFYSQSNINVLYDSINQMRQGKTITKTLEELEALYTLDDETEKATEN